MTVSSRARGPPRRRVPITLPNHAPVGAPACQVRRAAVIGPRVAQARPADPRSMCGTARHPPGKPPGGPEAYL